MTWRLIENFEMYAVSDTGLVKRLSYIGKTPTKLDCLRKEHLLKPWKTKKGYLAVQLYDNDRVKTFPVHRLVAKAFIPNPSNKPQVNHIDCDKTNNNVSNLEWCNNSENQLHAFKHGLQMNNFEHPQSKLNLEAVLDIKANCVKKKKGYSMADFARKYYVCASSIKQILEGKSYRNIS